MGLVCGLAVSMIGDFFGGDERATLLGVRTSMETQGQVATTAAAGAHVPNANSGAAEQ